MCVCVCVCVFLVNQPNRGECLLCRGEHGEFFSIVDRGPFLHPPARRRLHSVILISSRLSDVVWVYCWCFSCRSPFFFASSLAMWMGRSDNRMLVILLDTHKNSMRVFALAFIFFYYYHSRARDRVRSTQDGRCVTTALGKTSGWMNDGVVCVCRTNYILLLQRCPGFCGVLE